MPDVIGRILWIIFAAGTISYSTFLLTGSAVNAKASGVQAPVVVRDSLERGKHNLNGMLTVSSGCDQLTLHVDPQGNWVYALTFTTWEEPAVACGKEPTPRVFQTTVFAPSVGVRFIATLDGESIPLAVYPTIEHK